MLRRLFPLARRFWLRSRSALRRASIAWLADDALSMGAAIAFYAMFAFAPVLIAITSVAGLAVGRVVAEHELVSHLQSLIGPAGSGAVQTLIQTATAARLGVLARLVGIGTLLFGSAGALTQLQESLNRIWKVQPDARGFIVTALRERLFSLAIVAGAGALWLVLLVGAALLPLDVLVPGLATGAHAIAGPLRFAFGVLVLAAIYRFIPAAPVRWRDVWFGALLASLLFSAAKSLIGIYLAQSTVASSYGPAGSLVILLVWAYCAVQILLFGAEVAHAWTRATVADIESGRLRCHPALESCAAFPQEKPQYSRSEATIDSARLNKA